VATSKTDAIYTSFYTPSAKLNEAISVDFCGGCLIDNTTMIINDYCILDNDLEYDCSGYGHHGTIIGTLTNGTGESPKY
jgi:hypothetical protein